MTRKIVFFITNQTLFLASLELMSRATNSCIDSKVNEMIIRLCRFFLIPKLSDEFLKQGRKRREMLRINFTNSP